MGGKKKDEEIILQAVGSQAEHVTGSCVTVSYMTNEGRKHLLIELGGSQGGSMYEEYLNNKKIIEDIPIRFAEYCFVNHIHSDHIQSLPALIPNGFNGKVIISEVNKKLITPMLTDSVKIHMKDVDTLKAKGKKVKYLYDTRDMWDMVDKMETYSVGEIHKLDEYVSFRYANNSHVVGANQLELYIKKPSSKRVCKIVYTSDLGNSNNFKYNYFLEETEVIPKCDLLLIESTYGAGDRNFNKSQCLEERKDLKKTILQFVNNGHSALIPVFSYSRLQNFMCWIYDTFKDTWNMEIPIVVDTNLGNKMNSVYSEILEGKNLDKWKEVMNWKAFKYIKDFDGTLAFISSRQNALILSSSGMLSGGKSVLYAKQMLDNSNNAILFCGFCGSNTLGADILNDDLKTVEVEGETHLKRCFIKKYLSFSSHASQKDLVNYIKGCNCKKVILHHGEKEAKEELKRVADIELSKLNRTTKVLSSYKDMIVKL